MATFTFSSRFLEMAVNVKIALLGSNSEVRILSCKRITTRIKQLNITADAADQGSNPRMAHIRRLRLALRL